MGAFGGAENLEGLTDADDPDADNEDEDGKTATFPFLSRFFGGNPAANDAQNGNEAEQTQSPRSNKKVEKGSKHKFLDSYCINLSQRARDGKLDAVIGREEEIERVIQILNRRQKNNPCLIGEAGVGKTAIAEGIAERIARGEVPAGLKDKEIYLLDLTSLVAGTQFRGQFESRMKGLIEEIRKMGNVILVIDEVHNIVGAGDAEGSMNAANILKPALSRGEIQVIGATTFTEYRKHIEKDTALERRFQPVTVAEPTIEQSIAIIRGIDTDPDKQQIVQNIVAYAHPRSMQIIAEGVETAAELRKVIELGADALQGYFLAKPAAVPAKMAPAARKVIAEYSSASDSG